MQLERGARNSFITYKDHHSRVLQSLQHFQEQNEFLDVTLICENHSFATSKIMLASLSPYFYKLLKSNTSCQPTLFIPEISAKVMQQILIFMYSGQVLLDNNEVDQFLKAASNLELISVNLVARQFIKTENIAESIDNEEEIVTEELQYEFLDETEYNFGVPPEKLSEIQENIPENANKTIEEEINTAVKSLQVELEKKPKKPQKTSRKKVIIESDELRRACIPYNLRNRPSNSSQGSKTRDPKSVKMCAECKETFQSAKLLNLHLEFAHVNTPEVPNFMKNDFFCNICDRNFADSRSLYNHRYRVHKISVNGLRKGYTKL